MEEADEELIVDIDSGDKKNPLSVVEYIDDLYAHYKHVEVRRLFRKLCHLPLSIVVT